MLVKDNYVSSPGKKTIPKEKDPNQKIQEQTKQPEEDPLKLAQRRYQESLDSLNVFQQRVFNQEYMTQQELWDYRKAIEEYATSGNRLRQLYKNQGHTFEQDDEDQWQEQLRMLSDSYNTAVVYNSGIQKAAETISNYEERVNNSEYLSPEELEDFQRAAEEYTNIGNRLQSGWEKGGIRTSEEEKAWWGETVANLERYADQTMRLYEGYDSEEMWQAHVDNAERMQKMRSEDDAKLAVELAGLQDRRDALLAQNHPMPGDYAYAQATAEELASWKARDDELNALEKEIAEKKAYFDEVIQLKEHAYFVESRNTVEKRQQIYEDNNTRIAALEAQKESLGWFGDDWRERKEIDDEIQRLKAENLNYERGNYTESSAFYGSKKADDHYMVAQAEDFAQVSANREYVNPQIDEYILAQTPEYLNQNAWYWENGVLYNAEGEAQETDEYGNWIDPRNKDWTVEDKLGLFLSANEQQRNRAAAGEWGQNNVQQIFLAGLERDWKYLEEDEISIYYYYLAESPEKAEQYLADMEFELNRRRTMDQIQQWGKAYDEANSLEKIWMNVQTVPAKFMSAIGGTVNNISNVLQGEEINPYSTAHTGMHYSQTVRGSTAEEIDTLTGNWSVPGLDKLGMNFTAGDIYQSGMSRLDSMLATKVFGGGGTIFLGMGAAQEEAYRLYRQGASSGQIAWGALTAGAAEVVFEYIGFDSLIKIKDADTIWKVVLKALAQGGVEALEETGTEIANIITNAVIMGGQSDLNKLYKENGNDWMKTGLKAVQQITHAGFGGLLGGFGSGATQASGVYYDTILQYGDVGSIIMSTEDGVESLQDIAYHVADISDVKMAESLIKQASNVSGETATGEGIRKIGAAIKNANNAIKVGRLYNTVQTAIQDGQGNGEYIEKTQEERSERQMLAEAAKNMTREALGSAAYETLKQYDKQRRHYELAKKILEISKQLGVANIAPLRNRLTQMETTLQEAEENPVLRSILDKIAEGKANAAQTPDAATQNQQQTAENSQQQAATQPELTGQTATLAQQNNTLQTPSPDQNSEFEENSFPNVEKSREKDVDFYRTNGKILETDSVSAQGADNQGLIATEQNRTLTTGELLERINDFVEVQSLREYQQRALDVYNRQKQHISELEALRQTQKSSEELDGQIAKAKEDLQKIEKRRGITATVNRVKQSIFRRYAGDATKKLQLQQSLVEHQTRLRQLYAELHSGMMSTDKRQASMAIIQENEEQITQIEGKMRIVERDLAKSKVTAIAIIDSTDRAALLFDDKDIVSVCGKQVVFDGKIDLSVVDGGGRTNRQRIEQGGAPIDAEGKRFNIHHLNQTDDGLVLVLSENLHQKYDGMLHSNKGQSPSQIDRKAFAKWRRKFWKWLLQQQLE